METRRLVEVIKPWSAIILMTAFAQATEVTAGITGSTPVWESVGPEGGFFVDFTFHPTDPKIIFAGSDDSGGIWKSTDGGESWRLVTANLRNACGWAIAISVSEPEVMYAVDHYGRQPVYKSVDGGETWSDSSKQFPTNKTSAVAIDPENAAVVYVGGNALYKSVDGGQTWKASGLEDHRVSILRMTEDGVLYAATRRGLLRSEDAATTWTLVQGGLPTQGISGFNIAPSGALFAASTGESHSLYRSVDGGATWTGIGLPHTMIWDIFEVAGTDGQTILCGTLGNEHGVMRTTDGGATWAPASNGITGKKIIGMGQGSDGTLLCSTYSNEGIYRSRDHGNTWQQVNNKLNATYITGMTLDPNDPSHLLVTCLGPYSHLDFDMAPVTWDGVIQGDGAIRWDCQEHLRYQTYSPTIIPGKPGHVMLGTFLRGVLFSSDGGKTYERVYKENGLVTATAFDPDDPEVLLAAASLHPAFEGRAVESSEQCIIRSDDGGKSWTQHPVAFIAQDMLAEPENDRVWAATEKQGLFVSADNGISWEQAALKDQDLVTISQHPADGSVLFVGGRNQAIFRSSDAGTTWKPVSHPEWPEACDVQEIVFDPAVPARIYVGLGGAEVKLPNYDGIRGGFWTSPDSGKTWMDLTGNLATDHIWEIVVMPDGKTIYVGTYGGGVFRLRLE